MRDIAGRELNIGDLVFYLSKKGLLNDVSYGLVVSDERVFNGKKVVLVDTVYKAALTNIEENYKLELINLYNIYQNKLLEKETAKNRTVSIGNIYKYDDNSEYILYLGNYYIGFNDKLNDNKKDKVYIYIKCYYNDIMAGGSSEELFKLMNNDFISDKELLNSVFKYIEVYYNEGKYEYFKSYDISLIIRKSLYIPTEKLYKKINIVRDLTNVNSLVFIAHDYYSKNISDTNFLYKAI